MRKSKYSISGIDELIAVSEDYPSFPSDQFSHEDILQRTYPAEKANETAKLIKRTRNPALETDAQRKAQQILYRRALREWEAGNNVQEVGLQTLLDFAHNKWELIGGLWTYAGDNKIHTTAYRIAAGPQREIMVYTGPTEDRKMDAWMVKDADAVKLHHMRWAAAKIHGLERQYGVKIRLAS